MPEIRCAPSDPDARRVDLGVTPDAARDAAGRFARALTSADPVRLDASGLEGERLTAAVEGLLLGRYRFTRAASVPPEPAVIELCGADDELAVARGRERAAATGWARDLTNTPAREKTPAWLAGQAVDRLSPLGVDVTVHDERWLAEQGFGGVLAVGAGSVAPPRFVQASWNPRGARKDRHVVLVGKGITFDTGGINRKPGPSMRSMHTDMAGGAAVLAALDLIARARLPLRVTALVPAAENSIGAASMRPGDVVRHYGGRTSEILNTDAEGRLVLADALAWAVARLRPTALVDIATLTGAMKVALGLRTGGLLATDDTLAGELLAAGAAAGEPLWRMPLLTEHESTLDSPVADANNSPGNPGGITAALYLRHFAGEVPWAHLDIAGPARCTADDGILTQGATGFGARLLASYAESVA